MGNLDEVTDKIIGAAIEVHKQLGPGLQESAYELCLRWELESRGLRVERQKELPLIYKGMKLGSYYLDLVVEGTVIVELKAVNGLSPIHKAQLLGYMKLSGIGLGLLLNFNELSMISGVRRFILRK